MRDVMREIYNVGVAGNTEENAVLDQPNTLGLFMAYDSYKNEIIDNTSYTKGGDARFAAVTEQSMSCPVILLFTVIQSTNAVQVC